MRGEEASATWNGHVSKTTTMAVMTYGLAADHISETSDLESLTGMYRRRYGEKEKRRGEGCCQAPITTFTGIARSLSANLNLSSPSAIQGRSTCFEVAATSSEVAERNIAISKESKYIGSHVAPAVLL